MKAVSYNPRWLAVHILAILFTLTHLILDFSFGIFGKMEFPIPPAFSLLVAISGGLYALWAFTLVRASHGSRPAMVGTIGLSLLASVNGLSIAACPPPCGGAYSIADLVHVGSLVFCLWAIIESLLMLRGAAGRQSRQAGQADTA